MTEQHYRMTLTDAIALYKSADLTAKGALKIWVRIKFKENWAAFIDTKEVRDLFDMKRSTFWEALSKLEEEGEIELSEPHKIHIKRLRDSSGIPDTRPENRTKAKIPDSHPENRTVIRKTGQPSGIPDSQDLETSSEGDSSDSTDLFQIFLNSLSETERENFLEFGKKKAADLPKPPILPLKWIEKNFEELSEQWLLTRNENENQNQKYNFAAYSEPQHQMWYQQLQAVVSGAAQSGDSARLEQFLKDDFYCSWLNWAKTAREDVREFLVTNPIPTENPLKAE
ncbi:hypothetical protein [Nostoc sp. 2RC]|uniref:hypothetical protein n=1 Tax=Nostoc sp. 2RC TaxID=2485484 RepID=UPI0016247101|nr:hypothetical protein [Nostoc sp. 2RC]MBC1237600.1 hypothetical protein [Nostoc sp. 2RC]